MKWKSKIRKEKKLNEKIKKIEWKDKKNEKLMKSK